jgi:hypothetical protein
MSKRGTMQNDWEVWKAGILNTQDRPGEAGIVVMPLSMALWLVKHVDEVEKHEGGKQDPDETVPSCR